MQVNWEFLVERELLEKKGFLKTYTFDDFRITQKNAQATHEIICKPKQNKQFVDDRTQVAISSDIKLGFGCFVKKHDIGYGWYPPFDYVTAFTEGKKQMYELPVCDVDFVMCPIE